MTEEEESNGGVLQKERDELKEKIKQLERRIRELESGEKLKTPERKGTGESKNKTHSNKEEK